MNDTEGHRVPLHRLRPRPITYACPLRISIQEALYLIILPDTLFSSSIPTDAQYRHQHIEMDTSGENQPHREEQPAEPPHQGQAAAAAAVPPHDVNTSDEENKKHHSISSTLLESLLLHGFSENAIKKSIVAGCVDENTCTQWIRMHDGHPDLDTPLEDGVEVTVRVKRVLTEEERTVKVKELQDKIRHKKEEAKRDAHRQEMKQLEMGRKALAAKEQMDAVRRQVEQEEVRRQKAADVAARRRIKLQIAADRYQRQGKSAEEAMQLAERDHEAEAEKVRESVAARAKERLEQQRQQQQRATAATAAGGGSSWNLTAVVDTAEDALESAFSGEPEYTASAAAALVAAIRALPEDSCKAQSLETLRVIITNILDMPLDAKKRTLRTSTKAFSQNIRSIEPAMRLLHLCNFDLVADAEGNQMVACSTVVLWQLQHALQCITS